MNNKLCVIVQQIFVISEVVWDLQDGNDLDEVKGKVVQLSDENCSHTLEESSSVHVDRCTNGQDETTDVLGYAVIFLHTLHHKGQSGGAKKQRIRAVEDMKVKGMPMCVCREKSVCVCFSTGEPQYLI